MVENRDTVKRAVEGVLLGENLEIHNRDAELYAEIDSLDREVLVLGLEDRFDLSIPEGDYPSLFEVGSPGVIENDPNFSGRVYSSSVVDYVLSRISDR